HWHVAAGRERGSHCAVRDRSVRREFRGSMSMAKKAFCVGINDYPIDGADLKGCVNDAESWGSLLRDHFDFPSADIRVVTDAEATKANVLAGLKDLLAGAGQGDVLVFTNSSHGSQIPDP